MEIKCDIDAIFENVVPLLDGGYVDLTNALDTIPTSVPIDFVYGTELVNVQEKIRNIKDNIYNILEVVLTTALNFETAENKNKDFLQQLLDRLLRNGMFPEVPLYFQHDYQNVPYGSYGTVGTHGCGITSLAMVLSYLLGRPILPDELAAQYGKYNTEGGSDWGLMTDCPNDYGLTTKQCSWEDWNNGYVEDALRNGQVVIACVSDNNGNSIFTSSGHYIVLTGITEDGKILVNDPNRYNYPEYNEYNNPKLNDGFANGFDPDDVFNGMDTCWIFDTPTQSETPETVDNILKEYVEEEKTEVNLKDETNTKKDKREPVNRQNPKDKIIADNQDEIIKLNPKDETEDINPSKGNDEVVPKPNPKPKPNPDSKKPSKPEIDNSKLIEPSPENILNAVEDVQGTTSDSEYISAVLQESGYISAQEANQYKNLSVNEIGEELNELGWEKITNADKLQPGDIVVINNDEGGTVLIYAGEDKWYLSGNTEIQHGEYLTEDTDFCAYRPPKS